MTEINIKTIFKTKLFGGVCRLLGFLLKLLWAQTCLASCSGVALFYHPAWSDTGGVNGEGFTFRRDPEMSSAFNDPCVRPSYVKDTSARVWTKGF